MIQIGERITASLDAPIRRGPVEAVLDNQAHSRRARDEITQLKETVSETPINKAATELSLILRRYLASTFHDPALFETNEEFAIREGALSSLQED